MFEYNATVVRVVDGDTLDAMIDLGFDTWKKIRIRMHGINTPESRTRDLEEKKLGLAAKARLIEILEENKNYVGKSCGPGGIQFLYGEGNRRAITYMSEVPQTGDMFIFPAWLKHWVSPFRSDVTRISVSGNVHDKVSISILPDNLKIESADDEKNFLKATKK